MDDDLMPTVRRLARQGDLYCRIFVAAEHGKGMRLSPEDVGRLAGDHAIEQNVLTFVEDTLDKEGGNG